jgi:hypothetical protein
MLIEYVKTGRRKSVNPKVGKILVSRGLVREVSGEVTAQPVYQTRMMQAAPVAPVADPAPYGYKADGTPRLRPGRPAAVKAQEEE